MSPMQYLKSYGPEITTRMCEKAGTTYAYFEQIAYGFRRPSPDMAKRLESASDGDLNAVEMAFAVVRPVGETRGHNKSEPAS